MSVLAADSSIPSFWRSDFQDSFQDSRPKTTTALPFDEVSDVDEATNVIDDDGLVMKTEIFPNVSDASITNERTDLSLKPFTTIRRPFTSSGPSAVSVPLHSLNSSDKEAIDLNSPSLHQKKKFPFLPKNQNGRDSSSPDDIFAVPATSLNSKYRAFDVGSETRRRYLELSQLQNRQRYASRIKSASPALLDTSTLDSRLNFTMERLERSIAQLSKNTMRAVSHLENPPRDITIPNINNKHAAWPLQQPTALPADSSKSRPYSVPAPSPSQSEEYEAMKSAATYSPARTINKRNPSESPMPPLPSNPTSPSSKKQENQPTDLGTHTPNTYEMSSHHADNASTASSDALSHSVNSFQPLPNNSDLFFKLHLSSVDDDLDRNHQKDVSAPNTYTPSSRTEIINSPAPRASETPQSSKASPFRSTPKLNSDPPPQEDVSIVSDYDSSLRQRSVRPQKQEQDEIAADSGSKNSTPPEPTPVSQNLPAKQQPPKTTSQVPKKKKKSKLEKLCCIIA
ncbi:Tea1 anchoring protein Mod5 [Schizosaccharomyces octosporus yFS286]|uniref:Tea1 anchoring protein Mod5 n=1 Tax=Schizosaccharomyces octosporus (strain yFS286) TaxID=483514 RepID=S9Q546_SCHOY|nr:Tea1 anchoring protein Mod5 [Schizosaccharomyces octosporus yFS286]EPX75152.1 Tea1 anchoring protein Mod5 [Schizosaccharomyces octosporus yFS286]